MDCFALLMKQLAIPLGEQTTLTKWLVIVMTCLWIAASLHSSRHAFHHCHCEARRAAAIQYVGYERILYASRCWWNN